MKRNFKNKLAILLATLTLNTLNVPKAASWSAIRTLSKAVLGACIIVPSTKCYRHISSNYVYNYNFKNKSIKEIKKCCRTRDIFEYILAFFEFALVDIVVDKVADRIGNKNVSKEQKKAKNDENPSPADRK
jgi:hypothetical protein